MKNNIVTSLKKMNVPPDFLLSILSFFCIFFVFVFAWAVLLFLVFVIPSILRHLFTSCIHIFLFESYLVFTYIYKKNSVLARCINAFVPTYLVLWCSRKWRGQGAPVLSHASSC